MKYYSLIIFLTVLLPFYGCSPAKTVGEIRLKFNPPPRFIFGEEDVENWITKIRSGLCDNKQDCPYYEREKAIQFIGLPDEAESYWKPTEAEIQKFENELNKGFKKAKKSHSFDPPGSFWKYTVQYIGYVENGEKFILAQGVRCYSPDTCMDLSNGWALIFDGGTSVFSANYNIVTEILGGPWFNGYA